MASEKTQAEGLHATDSPSKVGRQKPAAKLSMKAVQIILEISFFENDGQFFLFKMTYIKIPLNVGIQNGGM